MTVDTARQTLHRQLDCVNRQNGDFSTKFLGTKLREALPEMFYGMILDFLVLVQK